MSVGPAAERSATVTRKSAGFAGAGELARLAYRRDIVMLPAWNIGLAVLVALTARDLKLLYPSATTRLAVAEKAGANPALRLLLGRLHGTSIGAFLAARWTVWGAALAALLAILIVVRHTGPMRRPGGLSSSARLRWGGRRRSRLH